jgi:ATP-binding cassette subfamily B protein
MQKKIHHGLVMRFAWHYWRRHLWVGLSSLLLMGGATGVDTLVPVYTGRIVDALGRHGAGDAGALHTAFGDLAMFALLAAAYTLLRSGALYLWNWFAIQNLYDIVTEALHKVQRFSADWHANAFAGGTVRKITRGMWSFDTFEDTLFMGLYPAFVIMAGMTIMLIVKLPPVGLFTAAMIATYCGISTLISVRVMAPRFRMSAEADTVVGASLADIMTGIPTVKSFGAEQREDTLFRAVADSWRVKSITAWQIAETGNLVRTGTRNLMMIGMVGLTIRLWRQGQASAGDIALALTSFFIISGYMRDIGQQISNLQKSIAEIADVTDFWGRTDDIVDMAGATTLRVTPGGGEIVFDRVRFSYANAARPLYEEFSLRIRPGEKIALVGPSGSGKTTCVKLLQRLYDVQAGEIRIDGQNIATVSQESLRHAVALVPQEPVLFHRSLAVNIAYGRPGATREEIEGAAREAYADLFIRDLPLGYDTLVGERGIKLSGGERQRVAIARAILADAPILVLDEATSSLDSISEDYIQKALHTLMQGRTTITIAHRLSTVREADRILVFDRGRIVEQGTHEELVRQDGSHYRRLYEMQALGLRDGLEESRAAE